jgi:arylformamidase
MFDYEVIELSHRMIPGKENFKLETRTFDVTDELPEVTHREDIWYVLSEITMSSHMGTHIEFPYHHWKDGVSAADFPVEKLIGPAVVLECTDKNGGDSITLEEIKERDGGRIQKGDIIFLRTGADELWRTERWAEYPYLTEDAMDYLISFEPKIVGTDATGFEIPGTDYQPNHLKMFQKNICMIESATNLGAFGKDRLMTFVLALPIEGIDACPVRIIALRKKN